MYYKHDLNARIKGAINKIHLNQQFIMIFYCLFVLVFFYIFRTYSHKANYIAPVYSLSSTALYCVLFSGFRCCDTSKPLIIIIRILSLLSTVYIVLSYPVFLLDAPKEESITINIYFYISVVAGILSISRPVFSLMPFVYISTLKTTMYKLSGIAISETDYAVIVETGTFAVFGVSLYWALNKLSRKNNLSFLNIFRKIDKISLAHTIIFLIIATHFSNYFYAGYAKLVLDGPLLSWLKNDTFNIFYQAIVLKTVPFQQIPWLVKSIGINLENFNFLANSIVLFFQVTVPLALMYRRTIIFYTVFYDVLHTMIFIVTGIFFWKWVILNIALLINLKKEYFSMPPLSMLIMGAILCLVAPKIFYIPSLGWYDSREGNLTYFEVIYKDGQTIQLPSNYFRNYSITFAQHRVFLSSMNHLKVDCYGATLNWVNYKESYQCKNLLSLLNKKNTLKKHELDKLSIFIKEYHKFILLLASDNRFSYNYFPHHIWSNFHLYENIGIPNLNKIVAYRYIVEGYCISNIMQGEFDLDKSILDSYLISVK